MDIILIIILSIIGLIFLALTLLFIWFVWRGDKTEEELPKWYNKLNLP
jgi:flagellar basal body-associated protein FliL